MSLRSLAPGLVIAAALVPLAGLLDHGRALGLPLGAVNALAVLYFVLLTQAPLVLQPMGLRRGASLAERTVGSLLPAAAWWLSEVLFRMQWHGLLEAAYLNLSLPNLLHVQWLGVTLVVGEVAGRLIHRGAPRAFTRGTVAAAIAAMGFLLSDTVIGAPYYLGFQRVWLTIFGPDDGFDPASLPGPLDPDAVPSRPPSERPPNIVVILSDDHRHDFMSHAGHAFVETPSLDRLANEGVRFTNAFVTSSLCSPSRASFLTGAQPYHHGVRNNYSAWNDDNRTFFEYLKASGYRTAFVGKWHMPGPLPELRGVDHFLTFTVMGGQGVYEDCPLVVDGEPEPSRKRYIAEELTDRAIEWLEQPSDAPFALYLSHKSVHSEFRPDPREAGRHAEAPVPLPEGLHSFFAMTDGQYAH
ncbi:MAG: sulfatase-like hydrolase/transferase, partial [Deltaproteobacteria bacterium]|nr:sulfatase-like hydrolase/transferase [Deltaproteobacteria bacterium]